MANRNWGQTSGSWHTAADWLEGFVPGFGDDVFIDDGDATISTLSADADNVRVRGPATLIASSNFTVGSDLRIGGLAGEASLLVNGGLTTATNLIVGDAGAGVAQVRDGGILTATNITVGQGQLGTLSVANGGTVNSSNAIYVGDSFGGAGKIEIGAGEAAGTLNANVNLASGIASVLFNSTNNASYAGAISGAGYVQINSTGQTVTLGGANSYAGSTLIDTGSTLRVDGTIASSSNVVNNGVLQLNNGAALTYAGAISGTGSVNATGTLVTLTGNNGYAGGTTITGTDLHVGNGGTSGSLGSGAINFVGGGQLWFNRTGSAYTIANTISGSGLLGVQGNAMATLTANNSYGATLIETGASLQVGNGGTTGSLGTGGVTNNGTLNFNRLDTETIANLISGSGAVAISLGGTIFTANNSYSGITTINSSSYLDVGEFGGTTGSLGTGAVVNNGQLWFERSNDETISNAISGSGAVFVRLGGVTTFTANNTYTGETRIDSTLQIGNGGTTGSLGTGAVVNDGTLHFNRSGAQYAVTNTINGGGSVQFSGTAIAGISGGSGYLGSTTVNSGAEVHVFASSGGSLGTGAIVDNGKIVYFISGITHTVGNVISGSGSIFTNAPGGFGLTGTLILTGNNTYSGTTTVGEGATLQIGNGGTTGSLGTGAVTNDGILRFHTNNSGFDGYEISNVSGSGSLEVVGPFKYSLNNSTYTGSTFIHQSAFLQIRDNISTSSIVNNGVILFRGFIPAFSVNYEISGSGIVYIGTSTTANNDVTFLQNNSYSGPTVVGNNATLQIGNGGTTGSLGTGNVDLQFFVSAAHLIFNRSNDETVANAISGGGNVTISGGGITTFTGNNSYTGTTTINSGATVQVGNNGTTGSLGTGAVTNNGTLIFNRSNDETIANQIEGSGGVWVESAGVTTFAGNLSYTGGTIIFSGTVALSGSASLANSSNVYVGFSDPSATLDLSAVSGSMSAVRHLTNNGIIVLGGHILNVTNFSNLVTTQVGSGSFLGSAGTDGLIISTDALGIDVSQATFTNWTDGVDSITLNGNALANALNGAAANATTIEGFGGDDTLRGGSANDRLYGGADNDTLRGGAGADVIDGGNGTDTADYSTSSAAISINFGSGIHTGGDAAGDTLTSIERVVGSGFADSIFGSTNADTLEGGNGDDILHGGAGGDAIIGGNGFDSASFALSNAAVTINLATNSFTGGHAAGDSYTSIENWIGSAFADSLTGDAAGNSFEGGAGADMIDGGDGFDSARYVTADSAVTINLTTGVHTGDAAGDTFISIERFVGSIHGDTITGNGAANYLDGHDGEDVLTGAGGNDTMIGGAGADILSGDDGADVILAGDGNDMITGGTGDDIMAGGAGNDTMTGGTGSNQYIGSTGDDTYIVAAVTTSDAVLQTLYEAAGEGYDDVRVTASVFSLEWYGSSELERLTLTDNGNHAAAIGNAFANDIYGGTGIDDIFGRGGDDTLYGGSGAANTLVGNAGNDIYVVAAVGDSVIEFAGEGTDTVRTALGSFVLRDQVENLDYTGAGSFIGVGNGQANLINGGIADDQLNGMGGDDILIGRSGADLMQGGAGADQFRYAGGETGLDRIIDFASGADKIALSSTGFVHTATVAFVQGSAPVATSTNSTFLYNVNNGIVSYDADGTGAGAAVQIAQLNAGLTLAATDFVFY